jgi:hypothetical protein
MRRLLFLLVGIFAAFSAQAQDWDFDAVNREALDQWRFYAVLSADAPLPAVAPTRVAIVDLPWQLERTRPKGFWYREATVPERFAGRDVYLRIRAEGTVTIAFNGGSKTTHKQPKMGDIEVLVPKVLNPGKPFQLAVSVTHGDTPARIEEAYLRAEPKGLSAVANRLGEVRGGFPAFRVDLAGSAWKMKLRGPEDASAADFDDSEWEDSSLKYLWPDQESHCWFRARITAPDAIAGMSGEGKRYHLRFNFNDFGKAFVNGVELERTDSVGRSNTFILPANVSPGDEVVLAARVLNRWGSGQLKSVEWRLAELDAAERELLAFYEDFGKLSRTLRLHDRPDAAWVPALGEAVEQLAASQKDINTLGETVRRARAALTRVIETVAASPVIIVPPYLQDMRPDQVTVMWETSAPSDAAVQLDTGIRVGYPVWHSFSEKSQDRNIHQVDLTSLKPNTEHRYRIISGHQTSRVYTFRTAPADTQPFTFLVWGDNRSDIRMCERVCQRMAEEDAALVVSSGDVVTRGANWSEWIDEYLVPMRHYAHKWPSYIGLGNHEHGGFGDFPPIEPFEYYFKHPLTSPDSTIYWFSFDYANAHFVFIDPLKFHTETKDGVTTIREDDAQFLWLKRDLAENQGKHDWTFVTFHEPPYSEGWAGGYYDGEPFLRESAVPLFEKYGVDIVFSGHTHDYERGLPHPPYDPATGEGNNAVYIISGGGGSHLDNHKYKEWSQIDVPDHPAVADSDEPDEGEYYKYHFCRVKVDGKEVSLEAVEVLPDGRLGPVFDRFRLRK